MAKFHELTKQAQKEKLIKLIENTNIENIYVGVKFKKLSDDDRGWPIFKVDAKLIKIKLS